MRANVSASLTAAGSGDLAPRRRSRQLRYAAVLVYLDMGFLPYPEIPADYHFGGHAVVVAGYDPHTMRVLVADRDKELHPVGR